jgi:hypothetical protein
LGRKTAVELCFSAECDRLTWKHYRFHVGRESHGKQTSKRLFGASKKAGKILGAARRFTVHLPLLFYSSIHVGS